MSNYIKQPAAVLPHKRGGWYVFRDVDGDGIGEYLYKRFRYSDDTAWIDALWIDPPAMPTGTEDAVTFDSKEDAVEAMLAACCESVT